VPKKDSKTTISSKIDDLKTKIDWFYSDEFGVDEAPKRYEEVLALTKEVEKDLKDLKNQITVLSKDFSK
jgi:peptidoglycan hydrolase CwlO-like protein